jgi:hypothetical protein
MEPEAKRAAVRLRAARLRADRSGREDAQEQRMNRGKNNTETGLKFLRSGRKLVELEGEKWRN